MANIESVKLFNIIKNIIDNYLSNKSMSAIVLGTYTGKGIELNRGLLIPLSLVTGNLKPKLKNGDKIRLFRNEGGKEYFVLEIVGKDLAFNADLEKLKR